MFSLDSSIGPVAVFCAPKCGCTSFTSIAGNLGIEHDDPQDWHVCARRYVGARKPVLLVRDPRDRLLSLWRHFINEHRWEPSFDRFLGMQHNLRPFFSHSLCSWYRAMVGLEVKLIRLETFQADILRLFGWTEQLHTNRTNHPPWTEYEHLIEGHKNWWAEDCEAFGYDYS